MLTLHGRTREQGFKGQANWDAIAAVKQALTIPMIANGDINNPTDALRCLEVTGADGVMVGRGTMGAPWLVGQIEAAFMNRPIPSTPDSGARLHLAKEQLHDLVSSRGSHGLLIAPKTYELDMYWLPRGTTTPPCLNARTDARRCLPTT